MRRQPSPKTPRRLRMPAKISEDAFASKLASRAPYWSLSYVCEKMLNEWNRTRSTNPFVNADYNMLVPQRRRHRPKANDPE